MSIQTTSRDAFNEHQRSGKAAAQRNRILTFIAEHGGNWSIGELARAMGLEKSTISARVNELLYETHQLHEKAKRVDRVSGIKIRPVGLPELQHELALEAA